MKAASRGVVVEQRERAPAEWSSVSRRERLQEG